MVDYTGYGFPGGRPAGSIVAPPTQTPASPSLTKQAFERMHATHGIWMVYIRANRDFPCTRCGPRTERDGDGNCPECFGLGYRAEPERRKAVLIKGRRTIERDVDELPGYYSDSTHRIYFPVSASVDSHDLALEVLWDTLAPSEFAGEPIKIIHAYTVEQAEIQYFAGQPTYVISFVDGSDHRLQGITSALEARKRR
jgi:hypothetical protein